MRAQQSISEKMKTTDSIPPRPPPSRPPYAAPRRRAGPRRAPPLPAAQHAGKWSPCGGRRPGLLRGGGRAVTAGARLRPS